MFENIFSWPSFRVWTLTTFFLLFVDGQEDAKNPHFSLILLENIPVKKLSVQKKNLSTTLNASLGIIMVSHEKV